MLVTDRLEHKGRVVTELAWVLALARGIKVQTVPDDPAEVLSGELPVQCPASAALTAFCIPSIILRIKSQSSSVESFCSQRIYGHKQCGVS